MRKMMEGHLLTAANVSQDEIRSLILRRVSQPIYSLTRDPCRVLGVILPLMIYLFFLHCQDTH